MSVSSNGQLQKPQISAFSESTPRSKAASRRTPLGSLFSIAARLLLWYTVLTALFRCPSSTSELTDESPKICKSYLQARSYAAPYLQPYYDSYLKPYVDKAQPHVEALNEKVVTPVAIFAKGQYDVYGAPRVAQLQDYAEGTWSSTIKPHLEISRERARSQYEQQLEPYVEQAREVVGPYAERVYKEASDIYGTVFVPAYHQALPYAQGGYQQGRDITTNIVFPTLRTAQQTTFDFLRRKIWPTLVVLYGENVEPQLSKIMERLGRYKDGRKLQAAVNAVAESPSSASVNEIVDTVLSVATPAQPTPPSEEVPSPVSEATATQPVTPEQAASPDVKPIVKEADTRDKIEADLRNWKQKFAVAADKGAEDLKLRIQEITMRQVENQARGTGQALVVKLEETAKSKIESFKGEIIDIIKHLPEDADKKTEDAAYDKVVAELRIAGTAIKERAQAIREWEVKYDTDTKALIDAALASTLKIVDSIRDLGLQQIGIRWANMEGVTYEDWSTYHDLKSEFDDWRVKVEKVARDHAGLQEASAEGDHVREQAMKQAQNAVTELIRIRDASKWKIATRDITDDFSTKAVPPKVQKAAHKVAEQIQSVVGSSTTTPAPLFSLKPLPNPFDGAADDLADAVEIVTDSVVEIFDELTSSASSVATVISDNVNAATADASQESEYLAPAVSSVYDSVSATAEVVAESVVSAAKEKSEQVSSAVIGTPAPPPLSESLSEASHVVESVSSAIADEASTASNKVFGGVMAATVEERHIILDDGYTFDDESISEKISSIISAAGDKAGELTDAVNEALKSLTATPTQGTVESATSVAGEQVASALSAASAALFGTTPGVVESASSAAADRYAQAVTAASYAIYGTPQPVLASIASRASAQFDDAVSAAKERYSLASVKVAGTPKPAYEEALSSIESAYSESLSLASAKLDSLLGHTASITQLWARPTQGTYESISSAAASKLQAGLSEASAQYERAKSAVGLQPPPVHQQYLAEAQKQYYQGIGLAHDQYSRFLTAASTAVYGTPTPVYQSLWGAARSQYTDAVSAAQSAYDEVVKSASSAAGPNGPAQSVLDSASAQYDSAKAQAANVLAAASASASSVIYGTSTGNAEYLASAASEQIYGKETPWTEAAASEASANWEVLVASASSAIYGTPTPWHESAYSQAGDWAAQATDAAAVQYAALSGLLGELMIGKEPDFTESVMARLSSAYYTGMPQYASSASSAASELYASASSVVTSVFTPPPTLEAIFSQATDQLNAAVDAASVQIYGTEPGIYEKASSAAADAASKASTAVYGTPPSYVEAAQAGFADIGANAQKAISEAIYGTPTGTFEAAANSAASVYSSLSSAAAENASAAGEKVADTYAAASAKVSEAIYGPEQSALESAQSRVLNAVESARARLEALAAGATGPLKEGYEAAISGVEEMASSVSSAAASIKDEL